jgi:hypothetical protein
MRLVAGITLVSRGIVGLQGEPQLVRAITHVLSTVAGILLLAGLWTPIAGVLAAAIDLWHTFSRHTFSHPGDALTHIMLATLAIALALVGRRSPFWMKAYRHSKPQELALTRIRVFVALTIRSRVSPYSEHEVSIKGWPQAEIDTHSL